jgi:hypothetical protein
VILIAHVQSHNIFFGQVISKGSYWPIKFFDGNLLNLTSCTVKLQLIVTQKRNPV